MVEISGWTTRGRSATFAPRCTIEHHTAASVDITNMLVNGRPDLNGPLCNFELRKDGTVGLLAAGRANHAGVASVSSIRNLRDRGDGADPDREHRRQGVPQLRRLRQARRRDLPAPWVGHGPVKAHKEITPRKIDPVFNMAVFRDDVAAAMQGQPSEEDDMTPEQAKQLEAIYQALIVPGTINPEQTLNKQFDRMREIQTGMVVPGTRTVGEAYELMFARVRTIERQVNTLVEQLGTPEPPPPTP